MSQISLVTSAMSRPDFRISDGLVVTPSRRPEIVQLPDVLDVGGVDEKFHGGLLGNGSVPVRAMHFGRPLL